MHMKIANHLWFDKEAKEAAGFYLSIFKDSTLKEMTVMRNTPSGDVDIVTLQIRDREFTLINAGPLFRTNPSISFLVDCPTEEEVDALWKGLSDGGKTLMEIGAYPFSKRYGWIQDRYGLSWQLMLPGDTGTGQGITPTLMFTGKVAGRAEEALRHYASVFPDSKVGAIDRYGKGEAPDREGTVRHASFTLLGQQYAAMDSARPHDFTFNEAISLLVRCDDQAEIDRYWEKLSAVPEAERCGWLKDRFGVSWQIVPAELDGMLRDGDPARVARVTAAFLKMKKLDIAALRMAYSG